MNKKEKMIYVLFSMLIFTVTLLGLSSCQETDEVPPVADRTASSYRLPDPQTLSAEDRAVIELQEQEYNANAE